MSDLITINTGRRGSGYRVVYAGLLVLMLLTAASAVGLYLGRFPGEWAAWVAHSALLLGAWLVFVDMVYEGVRFSVNVPYDALEDVVG